MNRKLRLKLPDPPSCCRELGMLGRRDAGFEAGVDSRLAAPDVDRLLAHLKIRSNLRDLPSAFNQIDYPAPELRRGTPEPPVKPGRFRVAASVGAVLWALPN